jgi:hypothetical protein
VYRSRLAIISLLVAGLICNLQFWDTSALTLSVQPGSNAEADAPSPHVSVVAWIGNRAVPIEGRVILEDTPAEYICQNDLIFAEVWSEKPNSSFATDLRFINNCETEAAIKVCWFNPSSIFRLFFLPACF